MLIDLHTHTFPKSDDSLLSPEELIVQAKRNGLDAVCVTDHDWYWTEGAIDHMSKEHNFLIIPGVEINTEEGMFSLLVLMSLNLGCTAYHFCGRHWIKRAGL